MAHDTTPRFVRRWTLAPFFTLLRSLWPKEHDPIDEVPKGLSDHHLRDIGFGENEIYRYRLNTRDPHGF